MKEHPLRTTVIGSYPFPGWLELACHNLERFGEADRAELIDDAVTVAIRDQLDARTTNLKVWPSFLASRAHRSHPRQTARKQAIQDLKIGPDHITGPDDSNRYWTQSSCSSGDVTGAGS